jgi:hypothetical protein
MAADPVKLSIASFSQKSSWFAYSTRIAELIRETLPAGSTIDAPPKGGGTSNPSLVAAGKFDMALGMASVAGWAKDGTVAYKAPLNTLRSLVGGFDQYYLAVVARKDKNDANLPAYVAANNRARYIIENYPTATVTEEALIILAETFRFLELKKGSQDAIAMLRTNFPESEAFNDAGEFEVDLLEGENRSLTNVVTFGLMGDE